MRGDGEWKSWRHNVVNREEDELVDTATSPGKKKGVETDIRDVSDAGAKRFLYLGFTNPIFEDNEDGTIPMITDESLALVNAAALDDGNDMTKRTTSWS
jgi:hypothetical protein